MFGKSKTQIEDPPEKEKDEVQPKPAGTGVSAALQDLKDRVESGMSDMKSKIRTARQDMIRVLEKEKGLLAEQVTKINGMIEDLRKAGDA